jgi:hypothetical protein
MARNRGGTLSLGRPQAAPEPESAKPVETPVFDPERLAVQTYSAEGGQGFIQGKNFFGSTGAFIREAPENLWYITTPVQEENNRKARARNRQIFGNKTGVVINAPALPAKLLQMSRENARASAAETLAE